MYVEFWLENEPHGLRGNRSVEVQNLKPAVAKD